ncbi:DEKNAAC101730 [Brettanomyces naardenensis]|uniref:separase n=1 Tax=Brettanomyces naardenensis TaxID=13370 RepID=A0A448YIT8_BRENA|nr:DEKNAAC101730 [Brettanomyces naardenensis]
MFLLRCILYNARCGGTDSELLEQAKSVLNANFKEPGTSRLVSLIFEAYKENSLQTDQLRRVCRFIPQGFLEISAELDGDSDSSTGSTALTDLSNGMEVAQFSEFSRMLSVCGDWSLLDSFPFNRGLFNSMKECDFDDTDCQRMILATLSFVKRAVEGSPQTSLRKVMHTLDFILIRIKSMNAVSHGDFLIKGLDRLFGILIRRNQQKRVRNISNLLFHFGGKLLKANLDCALRFWVRYTEVEAEIIMNCEDESARKMSSSALRNRCERIANLLLETKNYEESAAFLSKIFNEVDIPVPGSGSVLTYEQMVKDDLLVALKITSKLILNSQCPDLLLLLSKRESFVVVISLQVCGLLTTSKHTASQKLVSRIIVLLKNELHDNGLFLYFLSRISFIIEFTMTFKSMGDLQIESSSAVYPIKDVIMAHIYVLQSDSFAGQPDEALSGAYSCLINYCKVGQVNSLIEDYEVDVITCAAEVFGYHNLYAHAVCFLRPFLEERKLTMSGPHAKQIALELAESYTYLRQPSHLLALSEFFSPMQDMHSSRYILLKSKLNLGGTEDFDLLLQEVKANEKYSIAKQTNKYSLVELIFFLSELSQVSALVDRDDSKYVQSILSSKRAIRLLQSILKNFMLPSDSTPGLKLNFKILMRYRFSKSMLECYEGLMGTLRHTGMGKEFDYYMKEFWSFTSSQPSAYVRSRYLFQFALYNTELSNLNEARQFLDLAEQEFEGFRFTDMILALKRLAANEVYFELLGDKRTFMQLVNKYDRYAKCLLGTLSLPQSTDMIAGHDLGAVYDYKNDAELLTKDWMACQVRRSMSKMWEPSSSPLPMENRLFKVTSSFRVCHDSIINDPVFGGPRDSIISYPLSCIPERKGMGSFYDELAQSAKDLSLLGSKLCSLSVNDQREIIEKFASCLFDMTPIANCLDVGAFFEKWEKLADAYEWLPFQLERTLSRAQEDSRVVLPQAPVLDVEYNSQLDGEEVLNLLPSGWIVIGISSSDEGLLLTKIDPQYSRLAVYKLPFDRKVGHDSLSVHDAVERFEEIIKKSDDTTQYEVTSNIKSKEEKAQWWALRKELDKELGLLLEEMESSLFGGFSALFGTRRFGRDEVLKFKAGFISIVRSHLPQAKSSNVGKVLGRLQRLPLQFFEPFLNILRNDEPLIEDLLFFVLDAASRYGKDIAYDEVDVHGICKDISEILSCIPSFSSSSSTSVEHIVLVISGECIKLPWESIPCLQGKSVSRMPSLGLLAEYLCKFKGLINTGVTPGNGFYVLNPAGDLNKTESRFRSKFEAMAGWSGISGRKPAESEILNGLQESDLYFYAGHGGGEQYVRSKSIRAASRLPPSLLMGCSSGYLRLNGIFHPYGIVYHYLTAKCPMVLVNLWDVTDKDIDKFTLSTLEKWGLFVDYDSVETLDEDPDVLTLCNCVAKSRDVCKLRYLNGAAPVVYGLPLKLKSNE